MKLIIDIPEDIRVAICQMGLLRIPDEMIKVVDKAIQHSTPLLKEHGRLIDADELLKQLYRIDDSATLSTRDVVNAEEIDNAPTIIEADKTESEDKEKQNESNIRGNRSSCSNNSHIMGTSIVISVLHI